MSGLENSQREGCKSVACTASVCFRTDERKVFVSEENMLGFSIELPLVFILANCLLLSAFVLTVEKNPGIDV